MKKVFLSYAFTGEDIEALRQRLERFRELFENTGVDYYINMFAEDWQSMRDRGATAGEFLELAFSSLEACDQLLALNTSSRRSEGMLMEIGAAKFLGKEIIFAQLSSSVDQTYLPVVADRTFVWDDEETLFEILKGIYT